MALDGIAINNIVFELKEKLLGGRIDKIYQPQKDEIIMSVRSIGSNYKLLLSANASHPRVHLTQISKDNPMSPPMFCMVLRKYAAGSKITDIYQDGFERVIAIEFSGLNELGDMVTKKIVVEIMGKHSNIILLDETNKILDSIKHISHDTSSVREVLPGKQYTSPPSQNKLNPLELENSSFLQVFETKKGLTLQKIIYQSYTGISPASASEISYRAGFDASTVGEELSTEQIEMLYHSFYRVMNNIKSKEFMPEIIKEHKTNKIIDFSSIEMTQYNMFEKIGFDSISLLLESFYAQKDNSYHIKQKAYDLRKLVVSNIERCVKKKEIQIKTRKDTVNMDIWRLKGELLTANIYSIEKNTTTFKTINYYDENMAEIEIALDPTLAPSENAQRYYNKYNKAKRTLVALEVQEKQNNEELKYLESVLVGIENSTEETDLKDIRDELVEEGFVKRKKNDKNKDKRQKKSKPLHYVSSDGYSIYVGKSNIQNDELTMKFAKQTDMWLHTKDIAGSHVIIDNNNSDKEIPDQTLIEAANLAAYNSKGKQSSNVAVDYCLRKFVKKPGGSKPGMVIYTTNKTIYITPDEVMAENMKTYAE